jgi:hypothetical protein
MPKTNITIPYQFTPRPYQIPLLRAMQIGFKRAVIVWHRRSGKDLTILAGVVVPKMLERVGTYFYIFPTYSQGKKALWDGIDRDGVKIMSRIPEVLIKSRNETEMRIELKNGSALQVIGCENIDNIVGTNPVGVIFSEYPICKAIAWDYIRPILAENGGFAIFDFTPRGMNHGWKILQQAKENESWFYQLLTVDDTHAIPPEAIEEEKMQMPEDLFLQEYYLKFIDGAGTFFRHLEPCIYEDKYEPDHSKRFNIEPGKVFRLGVDLAKYQDFTVITPIDLTTFKVGPQEVFNRIDYTLQKARIESQHYKYNKAEITLDTTGVGEPVYDDLTTSKLPVRGYQFTETSRRNLLVNLQVLLEQEIIKIPNDPALLDELRSFQYELGENGKVKIVAPSGVHDDRVMSLALACWDLPVKPIPFKSAEDRRLLKMFDSQKQKEKTTYFSGSQYLRNRHTNE